MRGAADTTKEKQVSLNEAYKYAYNKTLLKTENSGQGIQHPNYEIKLTGAGDIILTDLKAKYFVFVTL